MASTTNKPKDGIEAWAINRMIDRLGDSEFTTQDLFNLKEQIALIKKERIARHLSDLKKRDRVTKGPSNGFIRVNKKQPLDKR